MLSITTTLSYQVYRDYLIMLKVLTQTIQTSFVNIEHYACMIKTLPIQNEFFVNMRVHVMGIW